MTARRRLALALIVSVVSAVGLAIALVWWPVFQDEMYRVEAIEVPAGESVEFAGYTWTLDASDEFPGQGVDSNSIPAGAALVAAILQIEPGDTLGAGEVESCDGALVAPATERRWTTLVSEYDFGYGIADDSTTTCLLDGEALQLEVVFLTPEGAYDDAVLEVTVTSQYSHVLRFQLMPRD